MAWRRAEVDRGPTFWAQGDGPMKVGLMFRAGHARIVLLLRDTIGF